MVKYTEKGTKKGVKCVIFVRPAGKGPWLLTIIKIKNLIIGHNVIIVLEASINYDHYGLLAVTKRKAVAKGVGIVLNIQSSSMSTISMAI